MGYGMDQSSFVRRRTGNPELALSYLERAYTINGLSVAAWFNWGRVAETGALAADRLLAKPTITPSYWIHQFGYPYRILDDDRYTSKPLVFRATQNIEVQYRVASVHSLSYLSELVPKSPLTAAEWWVVGEYALTVNHDPDSL
jgi:hypothetical protein